MKKEKLYQLTGLAILLVFGPRLVFEYVNPWLGLITCVYLLYAIAGLLVKRKNKNESKNEKD